MPRLSPLGASCSGIINNGAPWTIRIDHGATARVDRSDLGRSFGGGDKYVLARAMKERGTLTEFTKKSAHRQTGMFCEFLRPGQADEDVRCAGIRCTKNQVALIPANSRTSYLTGAARGRVLA